MTDGFGSIGYGHAIVTSRATSRFFSTAAMVALVLLSACSGGDDGEPVIGLEATAVGTCLDFADAIGAEVTRLPVVACEDPHSHEIFALEYSNAEPYPGLEALEAEAQALCFRAFEPYVGISPFDSDLFFSWLVPTLTSWDKDKDRQIICVIGESNAAPLVGSVHLIGR